MLAPVRVYAMLGAVAVAGCRLGFDAVTDDAPPIDAALPATDAAAVVFGRGCAIGVPMDEAMWTGPAGGVIDACVGLRGVALESAHPIEDPIRGPVGEFPAPSACVQFADTPVLHATAGLTLSAWVYPIALDGVNPFGVIAKRTDFTNDDAEYTMFVWTDNTVWVDLDSRNDRGHGTRALSNGVWQQITVVFDGALPMARRVAIYVDGDLDTVIPESSTSLAPFTAPLSIGCMPEQPRTKPQLAFTGRIDNAAVWTRAFSADDVRAWYVATRR